MDYVKIKTKSFEGNLGFEEMVLLYQKSTPEQLRELENIIKKEDWNGFKKIVKKILGVQLKGVLIGAIPKEIKVENPGILEIPKGKKVKSLPLTHFKKLIKKKSWEDISKAFINLVRWNKIKDPKLAKWADETQAKLSEWVDKQREDGKVVT